MSHRPHRLNQPNPPDQPNWPLRSWPLIFTIILLFFTACQRTTQMAPTPSPAATAAPTSTTTFAPALYAGFRYSTYGPAYNPGPQYWLSVGQRMAAKFPSASPQAIWIVGRLAGQGTRLSFPGVSTDPYIQFAASDENEATLSLFDRAGLTVWLQVEPGEASLEELIHLVLNQYGHHPCVIGVGLDVEWYHSTEEPMGQAVTDAEAAAWVTAARSHGAQYRLFLKHWLIEMMPPTSRDGLFFIDDSQQFESLDQMIAEFVQWGQAFAPAPVGFQFGYPDDRKWWGGLADPAGEIGQRLMDIPNLQGLYWVDFTVLDVFPPE